MYVLGVRHNAQEVVWKFQCGEAGISLSLMDDWPSNIYKSFWEPSFNRLHIILR